MSEVLTVQSIGIIITSIIAIISLSLSIKNYFQNKPKLKIVINEKEDCFFGLKLEDEGAKMHCCIAGAYINIINNSPVEIGIRRVYLLVNDEVYHLIDTANEYWKEVQFIFKRVDDNYDCVGWVIPYDETGLSIPNRVKAYDTLSNYVLFHDFPVDINNSCRATLIMETAIGKVKKKLTLIEINNDYFEKTEWKEICKYEKSVVKGIDEYHDYR